MLGKAYRAFSQNLDFLRLLVFKILQFKINNFPLVSVLPFGSNVTEDFLLKKWLIRYLFRKAANLVF